MSNHLITSPVPQNFNIIRPLPRTLSTQILLILLSQERIKLESRLLLKGSTSRASLKRNFCPYFLFIALNSTSPLLVAYNLDSTIQNLQSQVLSLYRRRAIKFNYYSTLLPCSSALSLLFECSFKFILIFTTYTYAHDLKGHLSLPLSDDPPLSASQSAT